MVLAGLDISNKSDKFNNKYDIHPSGVYIHNRVNLMKGDHNEDQGSTVKFKGAGDRYGVRYDLHGLQRP